MEKKKFKPRTDGQEDVMKASGIIDSKEEILQKEVKSPENTGESTKDEKRDEKGRFLAGISGNPAGKPPGSLSITALIKDELIKVADFKNNDEKKTYIQLLLKRILHNAIAKGDTTTQKMIWNYIDGLPQGSFDVTSLGEKIEGVVVLPAKEKKSDE